MRTRGNDIIVHRGESFTLDRTVVNRDGSPYIVSSEYENPYVVITVSSTRYDLSDRYKINFWLDLSNLPRFKNTLPKQIASFNLNDAVTITDEGKVTDDVGEYLYYVDDITKCKYFDSEGMWHDYKFRIIKHFTNYVTRDWIEQSYLYSIQLLEGESTEAYIRSAHKALFALEEVSREPLQKLYDEIKLKNDKLLEGVDLSKPLSTIGVSQVLLEPNKLYVMSDLNGGF